MTLRAYLAAKALSVNSGATPAERENAAQRCAEYELIHGLPRTRVGAVPWWTLRIGVPEGPRAGAWLANTPEFRAVLRILECQKRTDHYYYERRSIEAILKGQVDWTWFPVQEDPRNPWEPPAEMVKAQIAHDRQWSPVIQDSEELVESVTAPTAKRAPTRPRPPLRNTPSTAPAPAKCTVSAKAKIQFSRKPLKSAKIIKDDVRRSKATPSPVRGR